MTNYWRYKTQECFIKRLWSRSWQQGAGTTYLLHTNLCSRDNMRTVLSGLLFLDTDAVFPGSNSVNSDWGYPISEKLFILTLEFISTLYFTAKWQAHLKFWNILVQDYFSGTRCLTMLIHRGSCFPLLLDHPHCLFFLFCRVSCELQR